MSNDYELLDSGEGEKLERFGVYILARPCSQAVWKKQKPTLWSNIHGQFIREKEQWKWTFFKEIPKKWHITVDNISFNISPTDFGHLGIFPEQRPFWKMMHTILLHNWRENLQVLNLFAYSGGSTLACAQANTAVCHLDASKPMIEWARTNAHLNSLEQAPIRWIIDDAVKFLRREIKRGKSYDAIILDPPTFGRGPKGELFKIEEEISELLELCVTLLSPRSLFIFFSCHTPGFTPLTMKQLLHDALKENSGVYESGEMILGEHNTTQHVIPSGCYCLWKGKNCI